MGTISNVEEAVQWLSYTYLFVRMRLNHLAYGIEYQTVAEDPNLDRKRKELIHAAAMGLDKARMIRYNTSTGDLNATGMFSKMFSTTTKMKKAQLINFIFRLGQDCKSLLFEVRHNRDL